jgi:hypothetical protein
VNRVNRALFEKKKKCLYILFVYTMPFGRYLLAAGLYNGTVAIYDIRETGDKPVMESSYATGKHSEAVMDLKWVSKGYGSEENKWCFLFV